MAHAYTLVVNPAAGRGRAVKRLPELAEAIRARDLDAEVRLSTSPDDPARIADAAIERGRTVVACGGDGLVGVLAATAATAERPLGIVPTGSGNDFARSLGLDPKDPIAALDVLAVPSTRRVDLGVVATPAGERTYTCVASTGFDAEANRWANGVTRLSGTSLYVAATLRTLAAYRPRPFTITVDDDSHTIEAWLVAVANAPSYGGGMRVAPAADVADGLLDVTVVGAVSRAGFLRTFPRVFAGRHVEHPLVETFRGARVAVDVGDGLPSPVYADGEYAADLPVDLTVRGQALEVIAPIHH